MNVFQYFERSAERYPEITALVIEKTPYSYSELLERATAISNALAAVEEHFIGFFAYRSIASFASVLGILKSGKAYVPISPKFPNNRNASIVSIAGIRTIIVGKECLNEAYEFLENSTEKFKIIFFDNSKNEIQEEVLHQHDVIFKEDLNAQKHKTANTKEDQYAYMLFTSGSTGKPKGVPISHENLSSYVDYSLKRYDFSPNDRFTNTFEQTFDLSIHDMFLAWASGASIYCIPEKEMLAPGKFIKENQITCWFSVPSVASFMNKLRMLKKEAYPDLRFSFFCGEPLPADITDKWQAAAPYSIVENLYGPTEATIAITNYRWGKDDALNKSHNGLASIGKIFDTQLCKIVNEQEQEVSQGETGELLLGGTQVTNLYWENEEKTKQQFFHDSTTNTNWYRTGDLVFADAEGDLFFVSRKDFQVKIQGHRIELFEIDHVLQKPLPDCEVVSIAYPNDPISAKIYTFVSGNTTETQKSLLEHCASNMPNYMIPSQIRFIEKMPLNSNGKIDRKALSELL